MNYSRQRDLVLQVLRSTKSHPHAEWIYNECKQTMPSISLGTVYRNLEKLVELGLAIKVANVFERERYDATVEPHTHMVCNDCGSVIDIVISDDLTQSLIKESEHLGYDSYGLTFYGKCDKCSQE